MARQRAFAFNDARYGGDVLMPMREGDRYESDPCPRCDCRATGAVVAFAIFRRVSPDSLGFAQHGFAFILIAILNLVTWQAPRRSRRWSVAVHGSNIVFLAFVALSVAMKPEAPTIVAVAILLVITIAAFAVDLCPMMRST